MRLPPLKTDLNEVNLYTSRLLRQASPHKVAFKALVVMFPPEGFRRGFLPRIFGFGAITVLAYIPEQEYWSKISAFDSLRNSITLMGLVLKLLTVFVIF